jgi:hypothetical protein
MGFYDIHAVLNLTHIPYNEKTGKFLKKYKAKGYNLHLWVEKDCRCGNAFREFLENYVIKKYNYTSSSDSSSFHNFPAVINLIKSNLKLKIEAKYRFLVDLAFSHLQYPIPFPGDIVEPTYEEFTEYASSYGIGYFIRIGNLFLIRNECRLLKLPAWPAEYNFDLKKSPYKKKILDYVKKTYKRRKKRIRKEKEMADKGGSKKSLIGSEFYRHIWSFKESIDEVGAVFQLIPNTQDCNLISQLFELYSDLAKEFKNYDLKKWEFVENDRENISKYLEATRDFFAVYKK